MISPGAYWRISVIAWTAASSSFVKSRNSSWSVVSSVIRSPLAGLDRRGGRSARHQRAELALEHRRDEQVLGVDRGQRDPGRLAQLLARGDALLELVSA